MFCFRKKLMIGSSLFLLSLVFRKATQKSRSISIISGHCEILWDHIRDVLIIMQIMALVALLPAATLAYTVQPVARPRASLAVCRLAATSALTLPYADLRKLVGEQNARNAWNLYRSGRDLSESVPQGEAGAVNPKFAVSVSAQKMLGPRRLETIMVTETVSLSADGACKMLLRLADGLAVEAGSYK